MFQRLFKDIAFYFIPNIVSRGLHFFLMPVYARVFSPTEFGAIDLFITLYAILNITLALEITQAFARLLPDTEAMDERSKLFSTAYWAIFIGFVLYALLAFLAPNFISSFLIGELGWEYIVRLSAIAMLANALFYLIESHLRFALKAKQTAAVKVIFATIQAGVTIFLLLGLDKGMEAVFWGQLAASIVGLLFGLFWGKDSAQLRLSIDPVIWKKMVTFSAPLVLSSIAVYVANFMDRWMLRTLMSLSEVGIYAVAARVATLVAAGLSLFQLALTPIIYNHYKVENSPSELAKIFRIFTVLISIPMIVLTMFAEPIVIILAGEPYAKAANIVAVLCLATVMLRIYIFAPGLVIAKKTKHVAAISIFAAAINITANLILIPVLGSLGAAIATLLGGLVMALLFFKLGQREYKIPHKPVSEGFVLLSIMGFIACSLTIGYCLGLYISGLVLAIAITVTTLEKGDLSSLKKILPTKR